MRRRWLALAVIGLLLAGFLGLWAGVRPEEASPGPAISVIREEAAPAAEQREAPAAEGPFEVACPMVSWGPSQPEHVPVMVFVDREETVKDWVAGQYDEAWLSFRAPNPEGAGLVTLRGYQRAGVVWWTRDDGEIECHFPNAPEPTRKGTLRVAAPATVELGDDVPMLRLCDVYTPTSQHCFVLSAHAGATEIESTHDAGTWTYQVCRRWGVLHVCSEPGELELGEGIEPPELDWPDPPAGTGLEVVEVEGAWLVTSVARGSPAEQAGIGEGQRIVATEGGADGLQTRGFRELAPGAAGDQVVVVLDGPDGELEVPLTLAKITDRSD